MFKNMHKKGQALFALIIIIVLIGVVYYLSAPAKTKIDIAYKEVTTWTADNIKKDPVGYLTWALSEVVFMKSKIEARELALKTKENEFNKSLTKNEQELKQYSEFFKEAKETYLKAKAQNGFPVDIKGYKLDELQLKQKIVEANTKITNLEKFINIYKTSLSQIKNKLTEIASKKFEVESLKVKLTTDLELAKLQKTVENLPEIATNLDNIKNTVEALSDLNGYSNSANNNSYVPDLSEIVGKDSNSALDDEFSKIMGK